MRYRHRPSKDDLYALSRLAIAMAFLVILFFLLNRHETSTAISPETKETAQETQQFILQSEPHSESLALHPIPFNPNTVTAEQLNQMGLPQAVIRHLINYRKAGGTFRQVSDLKRIYGLKEEHFAQLRPFIRLQNNTRHTTPVAPTDTTRIVHTPKKLSPTTIVELNSADSLLLIQIKGIGPYFAHRILRYRAQLGGYISPNQLAEIPNFPQEAISQFHADPAAVIPLELNTATFRDLLHHPYLNYEQTKTICNHRQKFGPLHSIKQLSNEPSFSEYDLKKLEPYIAFD